MPVPVDAVTIPMPVSPDGGAMVSSVLVVAVLVPMDIVCVA